jgi:4-hydroxybenzoate polyprenyltransferase
MKAYYRVCRLEYAPGEIPAIFTVLFLGSASISRFFELPVVEALIAFLLLYLSGFIINALTDRELDAKYDTFKTSIPKSVEIMGVRTVKAMIIAHVLIAVVLAFHITLQMSSIIPIGLVLLGVFFGLGYSVRPFHFKVRGVWHAIALGSSAFFLPFVFLMFVVVGGISFPLLMFIVGFSFVHYGMEFGNQAIDYIEDKAEGVKTPPVRWGMIPSLIVALCFVFLGVVAELGSLYFIILAKGDLTFIHSLLTTNVIFVMFTAIILAGYYIPTKGLWKMYTTMRTTDSVEEGMPTLKKVCNYAQWQASGIMGVAIVSALIFAGVIFAPAAEILTDDDNNPILPGALTISDPEVEFYTDGDGESWANVTLSIRNDESIKESNRLSIMLQSWTAKRPWKVKSLFQDKPLAPYAFWNISEQIEAHDIDDTTIKIYIQADQHGIGVFIPIYDEPIVVPSQKKIYIFDASATAYEVFFDKKANVNVTIFNEGKNRNIGRLEVQVFYYYGAYSDFESVQNEEVVKTDEKWIPPPVTMDAFLEIDEIGEPWFIVKLFYDDGDGLEFVDDYTFTGYV